MINEKIKTLRKQNNLTQEEMADKLNVSRQAITKWESGLGTPDISNMEAISKLFNISLDELISDTKAIKDNVSRVEYDIFNKSLFEIDLGFIKEFDLSLSDTDKVSIEIKSDLDIEAYKLIKVRLKTDKKDLSCIKFEACKDMISNQDLLNHIYVRMTLPCAMLNELELNGNLKNFIIHDFNEEKHIEFDGKVEEAHISNMNGHLELTSGVNMDIYYDSSLDKLDLNGWNSVINLYLKNNAYIINDGRKTKLILNGYENNKSDKLIELNGYKAELTLK